MRSLPQNNSAQTRVIFPGEPHLKVILLRAAIGGKKGVEVNPILSRTTGYYVGGDDYALLHNFGYLSRLKIWGHGSNTRYYAHLTDKGRNLLDWGAGTVKSSVLLPPSEGAA